MSHKKSGSWFRDLCIFALLIFLLSKVYKRGYEFLDLHKNSVIHQLDKTFADQLYSAQRQANTIKNFFEHLPRNPKEHDKLMATIEALNSIEQKYTKNSPGLLLLGPIGTTSIILKENDLLSQLLVQINALGLILAEYAHIPYTSAKTVNEALQRTQDAINKIIKTAK